MSAEMFAIVVAVATFVCGVAGLMFHAWHPGQDGLTETRDLIVRLTGLVATMSALVLGLLIASANTYFNDQKASLETVAAQVLELDGVLQRYGAEAQPARALLKDILVSSYQDIWADSTGADDVPLTRQSTSRMSNLFVALNSLRDAAPEARKYRVDKAEGLATTINDQRLRMVLHLNDSLSWPFMIILVGWICLLFFGCGMVALCNRASVVGMGVSALSVASAIFLIMELGTPYSGLIVLSSAPITDTIKAIGG